MNLVNEKEAASVARDYGWDTRVANCAHSGTRTSLLITASVKCNQIRREIVTQLTRRVLSQMCGSCSFGF